MHWRRDGEPGQSSVGSAAGPCRHRASPDTAASHRPEPAAWYAGAERSAPMAARWGRRSRPAPHPVRGHPVGAHRAAHGLDRRRLRERPRHVRRAARRRPGRAGAGGRQQPRAQGRPARAARQGAVSGAGRHRAGGGRRGAGRSRRRAGPGARRRRRRRAACGSTSSTRSRTSTTRSRCCARKVAALDSQQGRRWRKAQADYDRARAARQVGQRHAARSSITASEALRGRAGAASKQALQDVYQIRVALGLPAKPRDGRRPDRRCRPISTRPFPRCARRRRS